MRVGQQLSPSRELCALPRLGIRPLSAISADRPHEVAIPPDQVVDVEQDPAQLIAPPESPVAARQLRAKSSQIGQATLQRRPTLGLVDIDLLQRREDTLQRPARLLEDVLRRDGMHVRNDGCDGEQERHKAERTGHVVGSYKRTEVIGILRSTTVVAIGEYKKNKEPEYREGGWGGNFL